MTKLKTSYLRIIAMGFLLMITIGTVLLMLPIASKGGKGISFVDALFTTL